MIKVIKPILFAFVTSRAVKALICDLLDRLVDETDNQLDDAAAKAVRHALLSE